MQSPPTISRRLAWAFAGWTSLVGVLSAAQSMAPPSPRVVQPAALEEAFRIVEETENHLEDPSDPWPTYPLGKVAHFRKPGWRKAIRRLAKAQATLCQWLGPHHARTVAARSLLCDLEEFAGHPQASDRWLEMAVRPFFWIARDGPSSSYLFESTMPTLGEHLPQGILNHPFPDPAFWQLNSIMAVPDMPPRWALDLLLAEALKAGASRGGLYGGFRSNPISLVVLALKSPDPSHQKAGLDLLSALLEKVVEGRIEWGNGVAWDDHGMPDLDTSATERQTSQCKVVKEWLEHPSLAALWPTAIRRHGANHGPRSLGCEIQALGRITGVHIHGPAAASPLALLMEEAGISLPLPPAGYDRKKLPIAKAPAPFGPVAPEMPSPLPKERRDWKAPGKHADRQRPEWPLRGP